MTLRASLSVDLDDLWAYQRTLGDAGWERKDSYLRRAVPRMLEAFGAAGCRTTVFVVGADAAREEGRELLQPIAALGHEVGNHSWSHCCWLHRGDREAIRHDLQRAETAIREATGQLPVGYRGPGFTWSQATLSVVAELGYRFDASLLPSFIGPLARRRLFAGVRLTDPERALRSDVFGSLSGGIRPNRPYRWRIADGRRLLEIPITTLPGLRLPFHQSYLCFLAQRSRRLARSYLKAGIMGCRVTGVEPTLLFHPLDWLGADEAPGLGSFPGMGLRVRDKLSLLMETLEMVRDSFEVETMGARAARLRDREMKEYPVAREVDWTVKPARWASASIRGAQQ